MPIFFKRSSVFCTNICEILAFSFIFSSKIFPSFFIANIVLSNAVSIYKIIFFQGDTKIQVKKFSTSRVNFAFLDGGHEYEDVLNDFHLIYGRQKKGDVVIFDDYTPSKFPGIVRAVDEICLKYKYDTQIILLGTERGYCIGAKK